MPVLSGLPGVEGDRECIVFGSVSGGIKGLRKMKAATAAGDNGAINVWVADDGTYRCEAMRYKATLSQGRFSALPSVRAWLADWLPQIW